MSRPDRGVKAFLTLTSAQAFMQSHKCSMQPHATWRMQPYLLAVAVPRKEYKAFTVPKQARRLPI